MDSEYVSIPLTTNLTDENNSNISRWDKQKGHFSLTFTALLSDDGESVNLRRSIMPLGDSGNVIDVQKEYAVLANEINQGNPAQISLRPCPEIRLAFTTNGRFTALSSRLQDFADTNYQNAQTIGITAFWQPIDSYCQLFSSGEQPTIAKFLIDNRRLKFTERGYIDAHNTDVVQVLEQTRDLMIEIILSAGLKLYAQSICDNYKPQHACSILANRYPFVLQHVFMHLPNLNILKLGMNVLGTDNGLYVYRHKPTWFSGATLLRTSALSSIDLNVLV